MNQMRKSIFAIFISLLTLSAAYAAPKGVKENSPPQYSITAPIDISVDAAVMFTLANVQINVVNLSAEDMAGVEITQKYASHITDVDINPLYRSVQISVTDKKIHYPNNEKGLEGFTKLYYKPDPVPNK